MMVQTMPGTGAASAPPVVLFYPLFGYVGDTPTIEVVRSV
jgi:hypothetical protein